MHEFCALGFRFLPAENHGMPNNAGLGYVDHVLWGKDNKPLAVVEPKRTKRGLEEGRQQAKLYADCLESSLASGRCFSTPTDTSTGSGMTRSILPARCRALTRRKSCNLR